MHTQAHIYIYIYTYTYIQVKRWTDKPHEYQTGTYLRTTSLQGQEGGEPGSTRVGLRECIVPLVAAACCDRRGSRKLSSSDTTRDLAANPPKETSGDLRSCNRQGMPAACNPTQTPKGLCAQVLARAGTIRTPIDIKRPFRAGGSVPPSSGD